MLRTRKRSFYTDLQESSAILISTALPHSHGVSKLAVSVQFGIDALAARDIQISHNSKGDWYKRREVLMTSELPILHFNDVYRVGPQKIPGKGIVDVTQFASMLDSLRNTWPLRADGTRDGLVLFSGDLFAPSVESSVTRGSHMVPVINELAPDVAVTGNHEFDFGYPQLTKLVGETNFPWLLSNIVDEATSEAPECLREYHVIERCGVRIGFIGLVEREWIATVPSWPSNFRYKDMAEVALNLSKRLRDPNGEHRCDLIIALTHSRLPNDIFLAKKINALLPGRQPKNFASTHGADLILGGHDHFYYVSRGIISWENFCAEEETLGSKLDEGDVFVVKSGTDFRELTELVLELEDASTDSIRRKIIKGVRGRRHETRPGSESSQRMRDILLRSLDTVSDTLKMPILNFDKYLDLRSEVIRTGESPSGNWFADVIHHAYRNILREMGIQGVHGVLLCAGALRGDTVYGPGNITVGDIMEILPFDDSIVAIELDGLTIWEAFEAGLSRWPAHEGRFPVISGFRVEWDSRKPPGQRVVRVALSSSPRLNRPNSMDEEIPREGGDKSYIVVTREYMAEGYDGYSCLKNQKAIIDKEQGQMMSTIVQTFFSEHGSKKFTTSRSTKSSLDDHSLRLRVAMGHARKLYGEALKQALLYWNILLAQANVMVRTPRHPRMSDILCSSGHIGCELRKCQKPSLVVEDASQNDRSATDEASRISPIRDGRLRDIGRPALFIQ